MKLKVLQLCHDYEDPFVSVCSTYNKAFDSEEHEVWTVFLRGADSKYVRDTIGGAQVIFLDLGRKSLRGLKLLALSKVVSLCRAEKFDLVVAHRYKPIYLAGLASLLIQFKVILGVAHEHDVFARIGRRVFLRYLRPGIRIAGVSASVQQDILSTSGLSNGLDRVFSLPNAIDETNEPEILSREEARKKLNLSANAYIFGTIGRLVRKKEQEILIQGLLDSKLSESLVVIIGAGPRLSHLQAIANQLGVADRVIFAGQIHRAFAYIRAFDAFVLPSGGKEAFGLVLLEAMMARVPIICSDSPGPAEVVGATGLRFQRGNSADLAVQMNHMTNLTDSEKANLADIAYQRMQENFCSASFREKFWALPPLQTQEAIAPSNTVTRLLSRIFKQTNLPLVVRHSIYRKLRRRGVAPKQEFEIDFFGLRYNGNIVNEIDANVFFYGAFEKPMLYFLRDFLAGQPGAFVDVGANVGNHSMFMSLYATGVHSFEPFPPVLERLTHQVQTNRLDNVTIHRVALGQSAGKIPFYPPPDKSLGGGSFVETIAEKHGKREPITLEVVKGDDYFLAQGIKDFSAIKVDVEGFEIPVLLGLKQTLARVRPLVIVEVTHSASEDVRVTTDIAKFLPNDYSLLRFENRRDRLFRQQSHATKRSGRYRLYSLSKKVRTKRVNVIACPFEILDQLSVLN
jgi:FkbM family methyltransferase